MIDTLPVHHISRVLSILSNDEIVGFPTGTVYGLGVNALSKNALQALSDLKGRDPNKTYSILLPVDSMDTYVDLNQQEVNALTTKLANTPLTLLVKAREPLAHLALNGLVGVRTADHPFTQELVKQIQFPVTATSANKSGQKAARSTEEIRTAFPEAEFMVVDGGTLPEQQPSTIAQLENGTWKLLRKGDVSITDLKKTGEQA